MFFFFSLYRWYFSVNWPFLVYVFSLRLNFYYKKHLRSLFLSKFLYISLNQIIKLNFGILQLGTKKKKNKLWVSLLIFDVINRDTACTFTNVWHDTG